MLPVSCLAAISSRRHRMGYDGWHGLQSRERDVVKSRSMSFWTYVGFSCGECFPSSHTRRGTICEWAHQGRGGDTAPSLPANGERRHFCFFVFEHGTCSTGARSVTHEECGASCTVIEIRGTQGSLLLPSCWRLVRSRDEEHHLPSLPQAKISCRFERSDARGHATEASKNVRAWKEHSGKYSTAQATNSS